MNNNKYFDQAENAANQEFLNADGFDTWDDADGDNWDVDGGVPDSGAYRAAQTSQPYILQVANSTASAVSNVIVLGAYDNAADATNYGNNVAITISMGVSNVTYKAFLNQTMNQPFYVGQVYLQSSTANQVLETLTVRHQDGNGNLADKVLVPIIDPYQQQSTSIVYKNGFRVDGYTKITISSILASATMNIYLYPAEKINLGRAVMDKSASKEYRNPRISIASDATTGLVKRG